MDNHVPFWGMKLITGVFYSDDKYARFLNQWRLRLGLEMIKMRHALVGDNASPHQKK